MKFVYLVYYYYDEFKIFETKEQAKAFILKFANRNFPKSGLYHNKSSVTGKEYTIKDFIKVSGLRPIKKRVLE